MGPNIGVEAARNLFAESFIKKSRHSRPSLLPMPFYNGWDKIKLFALSAREVS